MTSESKGTVEAVVEIPKDTHSIPSVEHIPEIAEQIKMDTWSYGRYGGGDYENKGITQVVILCNRWPKFTDMSMDRWLAFDLKPTDDPTEPQIVKMLLQQKKNSVLK